MDRCMKASLQKLYFTIPFAKYLNGRESLISFYSWKLFFFKKLLIICKKLLITANELSFQIDSFPKRVSNNKGAKKRYFLGCKSVAANTVCNITSNSMRN